MFLQAGLLRMPEIPSGITDQPARPCSYPLAPKEIAYFNAPVNTFRGTTSYAMSAPAFAPERGEIWYTDGNSLYNLHLTNGVWP